MASISSAAMFSVLIFFASKALQEVKATKTSVISHEMCWSCISAEDQRKNDEGSTLENIHTYAELKHDPRASLPSSFTICATVLSSVESFTYNSVFFTLLGKDGDQMFHAQILQLSETSGKRFWYYNHFGNLDTMPVFPNQWVKSCIALNTVSGLVQWVARGVLVDNSTAPGITDSKRIPTDLTGKIILGAFHYQKWLSRSNKVTNLNIFSSALPVEKMQEYTKGGECAEDEGGDYLSWDEMNWNLHGHAVIEEVNVEEPCMGEPPKNFYYADFPGMESCMHFCENLGSRAPSVTSLQEWESLRSFLSGKFKDGKMWLAVGDKQKEGEWRDYYNNKVVNFTIPWLEFEPNGGTVENCVLMELSNLGWNDVSCGNPYACLCENDPLPHLKLRGLCPNSAISSYYQSRNDLGNLAMLKLVGLQGTSIDYDKERRKWRLTDAHSNVTGSSKAAHHTFSLGRHNWTIMGDIGCTSDGEEYTTELKLSGCKTGNFTCDDGQCVSMEQRCNQLSECRDQSDENDCKVLVLKKGYNKNVPPVSVNNGKKEMVNVSLSIDLLKLVDIDEEDYSIEIQFAITLEWIENRATYQHLKNDRSLNALTQDDIQQLWLPEVIYENTDQKESTRLGVDWEWKTRVIVDRKGNGILTGLETIDETEIFEGNGNSLVMAQTYTHKFQCIYDLKKYPFDTQSCSIKMAVGPLDWTSVRLIPDQLHMNQTLDMPIFKIVNWHLNQEKYGNERMTLNMNLVLKRKLTSELMTTYFPTLLLTAITFATTFFKPFFFEAALSVNLTTMLVMTTIFISKMESLPPTSDIKMIDIWLIFCQIFPFVEVVLLTAMEYQREENIEPRSEVTLVKSASHMEDEGVIDEPSNMRKLFDAVSKFMRTNLKTLGRLAFFLKYVCVIFLI